MEENKSIEEGNHIDLEKELPAIDPKVRLLNEALRGASEIAKEILADIKNNPDFLQDASFRNRAIHRLAAFRRDLKNRKRETVIAGSSFNNAPIIDMEIKLGELIGMLEEATRAAERGQFEQHVVELRQDLATLAASLAEAQKNFEKQIEEMVHKHKTEVDARDTKMEEAQQETLLKIAEITRLKEAPKEKAIEKPSAAPQWSAKPHSVSNAGDYIEQKFAEHPQGTAQGDLMRRLMAMRGYKADMFKKAEDTAPATIPMTRPVQPTTEPKEAAPKESDKKKKAA